MRKLTILTIALLCQFNARSQCATPTTPIAWNSGPACTGQTLFIFAGNYDNGTYSWTGPNGFTSTDHNPVINNVSLANAGTYVVTVTVNGCSSAPGSTTVVVNTTPAKPVPGNNGPVCIGQAITLTSNTVAGATYNWTGGNAFVSSLQNPVINNVSILDTGQYYLTVTVNGCTSPMDSTRVTLKPLPLPPSPFSNSPVCEGDVLNLRASDNPGANYFWTGPNGFASVLQNPSIPNVTPAYNGTYNVSAVVNGCTGLPNSTVVVIRPSPAAPAANNNGPLCVGSSLFLTTNTIPGATYLWKGPNGFASIFQNPVIPNTLLANSGTYTLTINDGCESAAGSTNVVINDIPAAPTVGNNGPVCSGTNLQLTANTVAGATYSWTGPNGFTSSLQNPIITNTTTAQAGTYSVTVTVNGCTGAAGSTNVTVKQSPTAPVAGNNGPICEGATLNLTASLIAGVTYNWTGPGGFTSNVQNPVINNAQVSNSGLYSVTVSSNGCNSAAATTDAAVRPVPPLPSITTNSPLCTGDSLQLNSGFVAGVLYSWTGPNGFTAATQNAGRNNVTLADAGTYTLTLIGCTNVSNSANVSVKLTPATPAANNNSPLCTGSTLNLATPTVAGASYSWIGPNGFSSTAQNPVISNIIAANAGNYTVTVAQNGCTSAPGSTNVNVNQPAIANAGNDQLVCASNSVVNLSGSVSGGSTTGTWSSSGGGTFSPNNAALAGQYNLTAADKSAGTVLLTLTTTNNGVCPASSSSITITIPQAIIVNAGPDQTICAGSTIVFSGSVTSAPGGIWTTSGNGNFIPGPSALSGTYVPGSIDKANGSARLILTSTGNGSCPAVSDTMMIFINPGPKVNAGPDVFVLQNDTVVLQAVVSGSGLSYLWTPATALSSDTTKNPVATGAVDQLYTLTVTDGAGCTNMDDVMVKVLKFPLIPNTFTPNNDGINDVWIIKNLEGYPDCRVSVFNRYGQLVFESHGYTTPWNGRYKNKELPFGTYYYVIEPGNGVRPATGYVTIIK